MTFGRIIPQEHGVPLAVCGGTLQLLHSASCSVLYVCHNVAIVAVLSGTCGDNGRHIIVTCSSVVLWMSPSHPIKPVHMYFSSVYAQIMCGNIHLGLVWGLYS